MQMCIREKLKWICNDKNLNIKEFSEVSNLPYRTAQSYLNGTRTPNVDGLQDLCMRLRINLNWLVADIGTPFIDDEPAFRQPEKNFNEKNELNKEETELLDHYRQASELGKLVILSAARGAEKKETYIEARKVA